MEKIDFQAEAYLQEALYADDLKYLHDEYKIRSINGDTVFFFN